MKHASYFAKAPLLHGDHVIGSRHFFEGETATLIGERTLCFQSRGAKEDHRRPTDARATLVQDRSLNLSGKRCFELLRINRQSCPNGKNHYQREFGTERHCAVQAGAHNASPVTQSTVESVTGAGAGPASDECFCSLTLVKMKRRQPYYHDEKRFLSNEGPE